jgi:peptidoglycan/LPS O-acetylase OafA/YrhL
MFVFILGWLARHRNGWVVLATGTALLGAGITVFLAGFSTHQPLISRAGVFITGLAVVFAALAVRARRSRVHKNPGR